MAPSVLQPFHSVWTSSKALEDPDIFARVWPFSALRGNRSLHMLAAETPALPISTQGKPAGPWLCVSWLVVVVMGVKRGVGVCGEGRSWERGRKRIKKK